MSTHDNIKPLIVDRSQLAKSYLSVPDEERDLQWVRRLLATFPVDALHRLSRSEYDYYSTHGAYLPGVARLAVYYRDALAEIARVPSEATLLLNAEARAMYEIAKRRLEESP